MRRERMGTLATAVGTAAALALAGTAASCRIEERHDDGSIARVRWQFQTEPGGAKREAEVPVYPVPENPPIVSAAGVELPDSDLVLGVVVAGKGRAYPIRYLALTEILDDRIGNVPVAASW